MRKWTDYLTGRTAYRIKRLLEMQDKDKLSTDNFGVCYEQLPDIRKSLVDLAYLRDQRKSA